jgi:hypothetical protein
VELEACPFPLPANDNIKQKRRINAPTKIEDILKLISISQFVSNRDVKCV